MISLISGLFSVSQSIWTARREIKQFMYTLLNPAKRRELTLAVALGDKIAVKRLLDCGVVPYFRNYLPIRVALKNGNEQMLALLVSSLTKPETDELRSLVFEYSVRNRCQELNTLLKCPHIKRGPEHIHAFRHSYVTGNKPITTLFMRSDKRYKYAITQTERAQRKLFRAWEG